jgi:alkylated DNA nucleotide flippase Atl1
VVVARETSLQELLEGTKQYQVPLYQRTYSWTRAQFERLWEDVVKLAEDRVGDPKATHFIGSLVLAPSPSNGPTGVQEFLVVDGQQRLTTLSILLCAIRDHRADHEGHDHFERISEQYLLNRWKQGDQRLKLLPTQADRASYQACLDVTPAAGGADAVGAAYRYFKAALIVADDPDDDQDIDRIEDAVISGLALVSVTAQTGDNAHRIFESLNNTGLRLTQGDLLRNYLFMRLPNQADAVYQGLWLPLQSRLSASELEILFWLDLVQGDPRAKQSETYSRQQARLDRLSTEDEIKGEIERFASLGVLLELILKPSLESDPGVRLRLTRLSRWGTTTVYPILLHLLDRRAQGVASSDEIATAMLYIESFLVRRLLIGRSTANVNRNLLESVSEIATDGDVAAALQRYLSSGRKYYARDEEVRDALTRVPFYLNGRPNQRKLVLQWIEESYGSKEPVDPVTLTIEHVMPQKPTDDWRAELAPDLVDGEAFDEIHRALEHTLGNLTLTGYNSTLSNSSFTTKKSLLATSGVSMNREIAKVQRWGREAILSRANALATRVIQIWPSPSEEAGDGGIAPAWELMARAVAELPAGAWTTYGDLAALIGSHPVPVGMRIATHPIDNGHRVMQAAGTVSPGFRWYEPDRSDDPIEVLKSEGIEFDAHGRANLAQRFTVDDLAELVGEANTEEPMPLELAPGQDPKLRDSFLAQLSEGVSASEAQAMLALTASWTVLGGTVQYGTAAQTSCFLMLRAGEPCAIWPIVLYPTGWFEIVFQYLSTRVPFDDIALREKFREKLNQIDGIEVPTSKLALRPNIPTEVLARPGALESLSETLHWFVQQVLNEAG